MWYMLPIISGLCAASWTIIVTLFLKHVSPVLLSICFSVATALALIIVGLFSKISLGNVTSIDYGFLFLVGCLNALGILAYLSGLSYNSPSCIVALDRLSILYVVIFSIIFLQSPLTFKAVLGALLMIAGSTLLIL